MFNLKKIFSFLGIAFLGLTLAACSGENLDDYRTNDDLSDAVKNEPSVPRAEAGAIWVT